MPNPTVSLDNDLAAAITQLDMASIERLLDEGANVKVINGAPILHYLLNQICNQNVDLYQTIITQVLEKGIVTYLVNDQFKLPIDIIDTLPVSDKNKIELLELLIKYRKIVPTDYIEQLLDYCLEHISLNFNEGSSAFYFAISTIIGKNISTILTPKKFGEALAHFNSLKLWLNPGNKKQEDLKLEDLKKLEGWSELDFLSVNISLLFKLILDLKQGRIHHQELIFYKLNSNVDNIESIIAILIRELLVEIETLQIGKCIEKIKNFKNNAPAAQSLSAALSNNIATQLNDYYKYVNFPYVFPAGWSSHQIYVRLESPGIKIFVDNLGYGSQDFHPILPNSDIQSCYVGQIDIEHLHTYLCELIKIQLRSISEEPDKKDEIKKHALLHIYNKHPKDNTKTNNNINSDFTNLPLQPIFPKQVGGFCVFANFNPGLQYRLNKELFSFMSVQRDKMTAALFKTAAETDTIIHYTKYLAPSLIPQFIWNAYKEHSSTKTQFSLLFNPDRKLEMDSYYVNLALVQKSDNDENKKDIKTGKQRKITPSKIISQENIFNDNHDRVVISGPAGIGKSTFCRYWLFKSLSSQQNNDGLIVFLIPLRNLNSKRYPPGFNYSLKNIVLQECFPATLPVWAHKFIEKIIDQPQIRWVLDGYDELNLPQHLQGIWNELLNKKYCLISTRPHSLAALPKNLQHFELIGLNEESIKKYINNFFISTKADELWDFLQKNPTLKSLAANPLHLELLCCLWEASLLTQDALTLVELYQKIELWLSMRYMRTEYGEENSTALDHKRVMSRTSKEREALESIGLLMMRRNRLSITTTLATRVISDNDSPIFDDLFKFGIISHIESGAPLVENANTVKPSLEFLHYSLQEFFAAKALARNYEQQGRDFIIRYHHIDYLDNIMVFLAGILKKAYLPDFFSILIDRSPNLNIFNQLSLLMRCLNEVKDIPSLLEVIPVIRNHIIKTLSVLKTLLEQYKKKHGEVNIEEIIKNFISDIKVCGRLFADESLLLEIFSFLEHADEEKTGPQMIKSLPPALFDSVFPKLFKKILDSKNSQKIVYIAKSINNNILFEKLLELIKSKKQTWQALAGLGAYQPGINLEMDEKILSCLKKYTYSKIFFEITVVSALNIIKNSNEISIINSYIKIIEDGSFYYVKNIIEKTVPHISEQERNEVNIELQEISNNVEKLNSLVKLLKRGYIDAHLSIEIKDIIKNINEILKECDHINYYHNYYDDYDDGDYPDWEDEPTPDEIFNSSLNKAEKYVVERSKQIEPNTELSGNNKRLSIKDRLYLVEDSVLAKHNLLLLGSRQLNLTELMSISYEQFIAMQNFSTRWPWFNLRIHDEIKLTPTPVSSLIELFILLRDSDIRCQPLARLISIRAIDGYASLLIRAEGMDLSLILNKTAYPISPRKARLFLASLEEQMNSEGNKNFLTSIYPNLENILKDLPTPPQNCIEKYQKRYSTF